MIFFRRQPNKFFHLLNILLAVFLFSCGLDEYYYLPQVPQGNIIANVDTSAEITIPSISSYSYATGYYIFYRIYISDRQSSGSVILTSDARSAVNPSLDTDFNMLSSYTNPSSTSIISSNTFSNRGYFELEFEETIDSLTKSGGTLRIRFPTEEGGFPFVIDSNGNESRLRRSGNLVSPSGDMSFRNTADLNNSSNTDVAVRSGSYAYVSMYIVAVGYNDTEFTPVYSKPTHISIFKLPDTTN